MPSLSTSSARRTIEVSTGGCDPGRTTSSGGGTNLISTLGTLRARARSTARPMMSACPRWTPSNTPIVTTQCPQPGGTASRPGQRCTGASLLAGRPGSRRSARGQPVQDPAEPDERAVHRDAGSSALTELVPLGGGQVGFDQRQDVPFLVAQVL